MSLLDDILLWAQNDLKPWQSDAVRRLFQNEALSDSDFADVYALLKLGHGMPDDKGRLPKQLSLEDIPDSSARAASVVLLAIRDLKNVNLVADGQTLPFSPIGLTIIYGANASGKSGYSRVLKRACRARGAQEKVLPNANLDMSAQGVPQAVLDIQDGVEQSSLLWKDTEPGLSLLSGISVFDSHCARAYLDDEQDVAYAPYGLDVVENLAQLVLPKLSQMLEQDLKLTEVDFSVFDDLRGLTKVSQAIAELPKGGGAALIIGLGTLTDADTTRLSDLQRTLNETDPEAKAKTIELTVKRVLSLVQKISDVIAAVDDSVLVALRKLDDETEAALKAQRIVAIDFRAGKDPLAGTGEQAWRMLIEAARRFSAEAAYPTESFPVTRKDAKCVLCQQPLSEEASFRMVRFWDLIRNDVGKLAAAKTEERMQRQLLLTRTSVNIGLDSALEEELAQYQITPAEGVPTFQQRLENRLDWLRQALEKHEWQNPPGVDGNPSETLQSLANGLLLQAKAFRGAADPDQRRMLESEHSELSARARLSSQLKQVLDAVQKHELHQRLFECKDDLRTRPISDKSKELTQKVVSGELRNALNNELSKLGVSRLRMILKDRAVAGKTWYKLVLDLPVVSNINSILSEGEQRGVAIASFLAELSLADHHGGIVFDDPVSSLDHHSRQKVAKRLVEEAAKRQVIVFTHDTVFLGELLEVIIASGVPYMVHHLEWEGDRPGVVREGLPWHHQSWRERIDSLRKLQKRLEKGWPMYPSAADEVGMRTAYSYLRSTIERVVEDQVFAGVVKRYRDWVKVDQLKHVVGFCDDECSEIERLNKKCSDVTEAHDAPSARNKAVPEPKDLARDIADLEELTEKIRARRKK